VVVWILSKKRVAASLDKRCKAIRALLTREISTNWGRPPLSRFLFFRAGVARVVYSFLFGFERELPHDFSRRIQAAAAASSAIRALSP
jgi:hypothetical protein